MWSYAGRYFGLSCDPAFEETVSVDQGHVVGGVVCSAEIDTLIDEEDPHNVDGTVEIQDVRGNLKLITGHKKHRKRK